MLKVHLPMPARALTGMSDSPLFLLDGTARRAALCWSGVHMTEVPALDLTICAHCGVVIDGWEREVAEEAVSADPIPDWDADISRHVPGEDDGYIPF